MKKQAAAFLVFFLMLGAFAVLTMPVKASYSYTLKGPYWDDGTVANIDMGVTVENYNGGTWRGTFAGGSINTTVLSSSTPVSQILWTKIVNGTTSGQRFMDLSESDDGGTFWLMAICSLLF
jgi:hypothetical protein